MENNKKNKTRTDDYISCIFEKDMYDIGLPPYLENDISNLLEGIQKNSTLLDCLLDEVEGSINSAVCDDVLPKKQADHLRRKYLQKGI